MKDIKYVIHKEGAHYVAQCLNVDVSSFGASIDEAVANLIEAVELYFESNEDADYIPITMALIGEQTVNG